MSDGVKACIAGHRKENAELLVEVTRKILMYRTQRGIK